MRWGLIARSETDRGLGIQTYEMFKNLEPDTTLVVLVPKSGFPSHPENYPNQTTVTLEIEHGLGRLNEQVVRDWWKDLDVVVSVETLYDWRLVEWAKADGVKTVVHGNPEFWMATNAQPDHWWWPTTWRLEHLPRGTVVPVPCPEHELTAKDPDDGMLDLVHIAGNAMADRNGTGILADAMRMVPREVLRMTVHHQGPIPRIDKADFLGATKSRWSIYKDHHAIVLPRRYGGLCLPVLEAMSCGLAVIMSDCSPNTGWPIIPVSTEPSRVVQMQTGPVETFEIYPNTLSNMMRHLVLNRPLIETHQRLSREFAEANSWSNLRDLYYDQIDLARR